MCKHSTGIASSLEIAMELTSSEPEWKALERYRTASFQRVDTTLPFDRKISLAIDSAKALEREGNEAYNKDQNFEQADKLYQEAANILELYLDGCNGDTEISQTFSEKLWKMLLTLQTKLARCAGKKAQWQLQIRRCSQCLRTSPEHTIARIIRSEALSQLGKFELALADSRLASVTDPGMRKVVRKPAAVFAAKEPAIMLRRDELVRFRHRIPDIEANTYGRMKAILYNLPPSRQTATYFVDVAFTFIGTAPEATVDPTSWEDTAEAFRLLRSAYEMDQRVIGPVESLAMGAVYFDGFCGVRVDLNKAVYFFQRVARTAVSGEWHTTYWNRYKVAQLPGKEQPRGPRSRPKATASSPSSGTSGASPSGDHVHVIHRLETNIRTCLQESMLKASQILIHGYRGVPKDIHSAVSYARTGAKAGSGACMLCMGVLTRDGRAPLSKDLAAARAYFNKGANTGNADCMAELGLMMYSGQGGEENRDGGTAWLAQALNHSELHFQRRQAALQLLSLRQGSAKSMMLQQQQQQPAGGRAKLREAESPGERGNIPDSKSAAALSPVPSHLRSPMPTRPMSSNGRFIRRVAGKTQPPRDGHVQQTSVDRYPVALRHRRKLHESHAAVKAPDRMTLQTMEGPTMNLEPIQLIAWGEPMLTAPTRTFTIKTHT
ncbi:hypothetical protein CYMTET_28220 [Cymbomonas tetramitiformis]|uniref:Uncharacterized protein n=1 Tax=Cymbomonas tetramitiformis TaxID=36881 RepID=A0AAE0KW49_9CHLO|nr:hypothetical protein CYMTET_28220 [Cymbomonas tetramitiformis]